MGSPKKSAADIEALRWREIFQAALTGVLTRHIIAREGAPEMLCNAAAQIADVGLKEFYARYEREK